MRRTLGDGMRLNQHVLSIKPSSIGVRQLGQFMVSVGLCRARRSPASRSSLLWGDHGVRGADPREIVPSMLPARLAVGLGLGSGPCERLPAPCAPSCALANPGGRFPRATAEEAAMTSADGESIPRVFSLSNRARATVLHSGDCARAPLSHGNCFRCRLAIAPCCFFIHLSRVACHPRPPAPAP
jgi:hypothetical protein